MLKEMITDLFLNIFQDVRMTILGSRDHTCIHPTVSKMKNRNEGCREITDRKNGIGCSYMTNVKAKMSNHALINTYKVKFNMNVDKEVRNLVKKNFKYHPISFGKK